MKQKMCLGSNIPFCLLFGELCHFGFGSARTLKQHPTATTSQQQSKPALSLCGRTDEDRMNATVARGKEKQQAEVSGWGREVSTLCSA